MTNAPSERSGGAFVALPAQCATCWELTAIPAYIRPVRQREEYCRCIAEFLFLPR